MSNLSRPLRPNRLGHVLAVAAMLLLAGCASYQAKDSSPTAQDRLQVDLSSCKAEAASTNERADWPLKGIFVGALLGAASGANWAWQGWSGEGAWIGAAVGAGVGFVVGLGSSTVERNKAVSQCMKQRGYRAS